MNLIDKQLQKIKFEKRMGLMTHVVVGYPTLEDTTKIVETMIEEGVDFIELQIPFSDPLADGPTIMRACEKALENGIKVKDAFILVRNLSKKFKIPLLFMAYYNTVFKYGTKKFCMDAKKARISGLIVPDIPLDEEHEENFIKYCEEANLKNIRVISPASTNERLMKNSIVANGFIYCTAHQGITGIQNKLDEGIASYLKRVRKFFSIPIAVGFGISKKEHIKTISAYAQIAVVGSGIIEVIKNSKKEMLRENIKHFIKQLKYANILI